MTDQAPPVDASEMTPDELVEAKRYGHQGLICMLLDQGIDLVFLASAAFLLARPLDAWLQGFTLPGRSDSIRLVVLMLIVTMLHVVVSFPLSYYSGFVLEHRFGLSKLSTFGWLWRYTKRLLLSVVFGTLMFVGLFWLIWTTGPYWWLAAAGAFFLVSVVLGQLMPVLIMPLFYTIERLEEPELKERINRLAEDTGLGIEGVYRMVLSQETVKANAMLAGLGRTRRVLLGDTLLDQFTHDEIEVIFAHEIGHHVLRHIRKMILMGILYSAAGFWVCDRLLAAWVGDTFEYASLPVWTLPMIMFFLTLFALLLEPMQNAISRRFERQSDRYALDRTGMKEAYQSAFRKLARLNKDDPAPHPLKVFLFYSHPPIAERLAICETER